MNPSPSLQTILTVLSGHTAARVRTFPWGLTVEPFAVGSQGGWIIEAPGVAPVHFYLGFDGRQLHVATAAPNLQLWMGAIPAGPAWAPVPVGSELRFGEARIGVTCEELAAEPLAYEPRPSPIPASPMRAPSRRTHVIADNRTAAPGPLGTLRQEPSSDAPPAPAAVKAPVLGFVAVQPNVRRHEDPPAPAQTPQPQIQAQPPAQGMPPSPHVQHTAAQAVHPAPMRTIAMDAPRIAPAPAPGFAPQPAVPPAGHGAARLPSTAPLGQPDFGANLAPPHDPARVTGGLTTAPSARRPLEVAQGSLPETGITVSDDGALRDLAKQVATGVAAAADASAQDAYFAQVRQKSGATPPKTDIAPGPLGNLGPAYPPTAQPPLYAQNAGALPPAANAGAYPPGAGPVGGNAWGPPGYASAPPNVATEPPPPQPLPPAQPKDAPAKPPSKLATAWRETSLVKKITLVLLPFAGYFGLLWEPPGEAPPPEATTVATRPNAQPASSGAAATKVTSGATPTATASGAAAKTGTSNAPASNSAAVTSSAEPALGPGARAPGSDAVASNDKVAPATTAAPAPRVAAAPGASASAAPGPGALPRDAFNAAYEGRLQEAARRYESLSKISDERVYTLAARFAREQAVRKP